MNYDFLNTVLNRAIVDDGYIPNLPNLKKDLSSPTYHQDNKKCYNEIQEIILFVCGKCGLEFDFKQNLEQHLDYYHTELQAPKDLKMQLLPNFEAECQICCTSVQATLRELQFHHLQHHQYKPYKCRCHNYYFQDIQTATAHLNCQQMLMKNGNEPQLPNAIISMANTLRKIQTPKHQAESGNQTTKHQADSGHQSTKTSTTFNSKRGDSSQMISIKDELQSTSLDGLDAFTPEKSIGYKCPECGSDFKDENTWKIHCNQDHDFRSMEGLKMTRDECGGARCTECNFLILKWDNYKLRRHKMTHSAYKAFHCKICTYSRKRKDDVLNHIRRSHIQQSQIKQNYFKDDDDEVINDS